MVLLSHTPLLSVDSLTLYYATDPLLSNAPILVFYGSSSTSNGSSSGSYNQVHVFTPAGIQSFPRLAVSPASPLYSAVTCLTRDDQGDQVCRGLAFGLYKYLSELSEGTKDAWLRLSLSTDRPSSALKLFSETHAANLASRMTKAKNTKEVIGNIESAMACQSLSSLDVDLVLPQGSIRDLSDFGESFLSDLTEMEVNDLRYGTFAPLVTLMGSASFLPTSSIRRARSTASAMNRGAIFSKTQKESLRREMCELVDTEESYVRKLYDLVNSVAMGFREKARSKSLSSSSPTEKALLDLFPPSLDVILEVNTGFLHAAQAVLDETENEAIRDIEASIDDAKSDSRAREVDLTDPTGALKFSLCLLDWVPKFAECYSEYVQAHSKFGQHLREFMNDISSTFSRRVQETGEQRLMSMLIEPVQRLPRYSLYIDNILKQLPKWHPALKHFFKAKDIIGDICSQDESVSKQAKVLGRLRTLIPSWPASFQPTGRLINAADMIELRPPYNPDQHQDDMQMFVMLLFASNLVLLRRANKSSLSAKGLLVEVDNPLNASFGQSTLQNSTQPQSLVFTEWIALTTAQFTEVHEDRVLRLSVSNQSPASFTRKETIGTASEQGEIRYFLTENVFHDRASRWVKEVVKARVESRFPEEGRDGAKWEARSVELNDPGLELLTAVFEDGPKPGNIVPGRAGIAATRLTVDTGSGIRSAKAERNGVEIAATISILDNDFFRLEVDAPNERGTKDIVTSSEFLPVMIKRISSMLHKRYQTNTFNLSPCLLRHNLKILQSLNVLVEHDGRDTLKIRNIRPPSPVKILANLFGNAPAKNYSSPKKATQRLLENIINPPTLLEPQVQARATATVETHDADSPGGALQRLEESFNAYILALHARKGNVVGRVVQSRASANESEVNELYNTMLETSNNNYQAAAQAPVDVLFAAFEKFTQVAWRDTMGPIVSLKDLESMQAEYGGDIHIILADFAPQNRRALKAIIELLAELLGGAGNDGDRGILMAAFTEILTPKSILEHGSSSTRPHDFIPLFDRFVEDYGSVFGEVYRSGQTTPNGRANSEAGTNGRSSRPGSLNSKASSLSKRLGFGSLKDSKLEFSSRSGQVFRTLSKNARLGESSFSTKPRQLYELDLTFVSPKRPASRDRPDFLNAFEELRPGTGGSYDQVKPLPPARDASPATPSSVKKKRRSSLSDLRSPPKVNNSPTCTSPTFLHIGLSPPRAAHDHPEMSQLHSPSKNTKRMIDSKSPSPPVVSSERKENISPISNVHDDRQVTNQTPPVASQGVESSYSLAASPRRILSERPGSGNTPPPPPAKCGIDGKSSSPKKLRIQSPQKLRERLQNQQKAIAQASASLQAELVSIGEEISVLDLKPVGRIVPDLPSPSRAEKLTIQNLSTRLKALESRVTHLTANLSNHNRANEKVVTSALQTSEDRAKNLEDRLALADAENVAIYERMNDELSKIFSGCKEGRAIEELKRKLAEAYDESTKWKKESLRLRRENVALRAQVGL